MAATEQINEAKVPSFRWGIPIGAVVLVAAAGAAFYLADLIAVPTKITAALPPVPVHVETTQLTNVPVFLDGLGTVQAFNTVTMKTRIDGQVQKILFTEGQNVKKGDLLAVIDPRGYQAAVEEASAKLQQDQANLTNANFILVRDQKLAAQNITTAEQLETQQSLVASLQAQIAQDQAAKDSATVSLSYTNIVAPINGRTGFRLVDEGNEVHTTDTNGIVVITQTKPISVVSTLSEDDLPTVRKALNAGPVQVVAYTRDGSSPIASGTLTLVDNVIDQSSGTARLKSTFANLDEALWPGQFVDTRIQSEIMNGAITISSDALQRGPNGYFVWMVDHDNVVSPQPVKPGPIQDDRAVVTSGLDAGQVVVTSGQYRLAPGAKIYVLSDQPPVAAKKE